VLAFSLRALPCWRRSPTASFGWVTILGFFVFGEIPDLLDRAGAAVPYMQWGLHGPPERCGARSAGPVAVSQP